MRNGVTFILPDLLMVGNKALNFDNNGFESLSGIHINYEKEI